MNPSPLALALLAAVALAAVPAVPAAAQAPAAPAPSAPPPAAASPAPAPARILTLDEALRLAASRQPQLRQAKASTEASHARADQALAPLLPQVTGTASYEHAESQGDRSVTVGGVTVGGGSDVRDQWSAGLTGRVLVYDFGQTFGRWRAARAAASGQEASERGTAQGITLGIRTAYFDAVAAKALLGVARETLANEAKHLEQIRAFVEVGTRPPIDLVQERVNLANARVRLIQAENGYATARVLLEQAIGATDLGTYDVADTTLPPVQGEDAAPEVLLGEAIAARPDLAALREQLRAQELTVRAVGGGYGPSLAVQAGVNESGPRPTDLAWDWNTQVVLSWPLFQGGQTRAQVREARANATALSAQSDQLAQQVRVEVEQARLGVRAARESLVAAEDAAGAARERLTLAEGRYQTGVGSLLELSDAQVALTTALGQRVQAEFQLATARSQLLRALGRP